VQGFGGGELKVIQKEAGSSSWTLRGGSSYTPPIASEIAMDIRSGLLYSNGVWGHNTIVIAYENGGTTHMMQSDYYQVWQQRGSLYSGTAFARPSILINGNTIYVARSIYNSAGDHVYVDQTDLYSTWMGWQSLGGGPVTSDGYNFPPTLGFNPATNNVSIFYGEFNSNTTAYAFKLANYDGTNWNQLGADIFTGAVHPVVVGQPFDFDFHPITGEPYVLFREGSSQPGGLSLSVKKYNGSTWNNVGSPVFMNRQVGDLHFHPQTMAPYVLGHWGGGSPNISVEYYDDGCSRRLSSTADPITNPVPFAANYQFEVINWSAGMAQIVSSNNNSILITDVPGWTSNTTYSIRSRAFINNGFFTYWTSWTEVCYITSPASLGETRGKTNASFSDNASELNIYPNPSTGIVNISLGMEVKDQAFTLFLYNGAGQLVRSLDQSIFSPAGETELDLNDLPKGIYSLVGQAGAVSVREKLLLN
jgi:hypothetical protein